MTKGIIWDLDGTLYDFYTPSKLALYKTWEKAYFQEMVCQQKSQELFDTQNGEYMWEYKFWENLYTLIKQEGFTDISEKFLALVIERSWPVVSNVATRDLARIWWTAFFNLIHLYPWVKPVLHKLAKLQIPVGLLSNSPKGIGNMKLYALGLADFFTIHNTVWANDLKAPKPNKTPFLEICDLLQIEPSSSLVIGDNYQTDILGAKQTGMKFHLYHPENELNMLKCVKSIIS